MNSVEIVLGLIFVAVILASIAQQAGVPYPTLLVLGGLAVGLVPGLPHVNLPPDTAFLVFVPPLVYQVAFRFVLRDLRYDGWSILRLSVGLVLFNLVCIAGVSHWGIDGFTWGAAFVLAAIVSPTDTAAVTAVTRNLPIPRRVERILEGESLFNDVVALVAYQQAVKAVTTGSFSFGAAFEDMIWEAAGGLGVGLVVGMMATWLRRRVLDPSINTAASLLTPFAAYLGAEGLGASGVLATVAAGLYIGHVLVGSLRPVERVQTLAFWEATRFLLEGLAFVLIGLQLRVVVSDLANVPPMELLRDCALVCGATVVVRLVYVVAWTGWLHFVRPHPRVDAPPPTFGCQVLIGWAGMRGVDSLAAALALPLVIADGTTPFPQRNVILLVSFSVILPTLVLQGLTLPLLIRRLGVPARGSMRWEETRIRLSAAESSIERIEELARSIGADPEITNRLREQYQLRIRHYRAGLERPESGPPGSTIDAANRLMLELVKAERQVVVAMWSKGLISDESRRNVERALDYEELTLST